MILIAVTGSAWPSLKAQEPSPTTSAIPAEASATTNTETPTAANPLDAPHKLYLTGQFEQAIKQYELIIRNNSVDAAAAYAGIARAYLRLRKPDDAYDAASNAVKLNPSLSTAHSALGEVLFRQGQLQESLEQFMLPFKMGQADARSYFGIEKIDRASFDYKRAKLAIDRAYALAPNDPEISREWIATRPLPERVKAMEAIVDGPNPFYTRSEIADIKHEVAVLKDKGEHPERTCHLANPPDSAELELVPVDTFLGLEVTVNGEKSKLAVDASSSDIIISGKFAGKTHLQQIVRTDVEGPGEQRPPESYVGFARSVQIGKLEFDNCYVTVIENSARGSFFDALPGTIGMRLFSDYLVDLDMPAGKVVLSPLSKRVEAEEPSAARTDAADPDATKFQDSYVAPEMSKWFRVWQFSDVVVLPAAINDSPPALFALDTVSFANTMSADFAEKWASFRRKTSSVYSTDGKVTTKWSGKVRLRFGGYYFDSRAEPSFDMKTSNDDVGTEISGTLGFEVLHILRTTLDYRDGLIHFDQPAVPR